jgi:hypothetical protein
MKRSSRTSRGGITSLRSAPTLKRSAKKMLILIKWFLIVSAYLAPAVAVLLLRNCWNNTRCNSTICKIVRVLIYPVAWILGLVLLQGSLAVHQKKWLQDHEGFPMTEEGMLEFGDAPNVTATWIFTGWIALVICAIVIKTIRSKSDETNNVAQSDAKTQA